MEARALGPPASRSTPTSVDSVGGASESVPVGVARSPGGRGQCQASDPASS
jgi:hypothetical protein